VAPVITYKATVSREGDWWVIDVQGVGVTQAKRLDQVDRMARDLVSLMEDVPADVVQVAVTVRLDDDTETLRRNHERLRREAEAATQIASGAREQLMRSLQAAKLSSRDIAELTGVSHQRVSQIIGCRS
jgi:DNA-directed RNA polymerase specialized sigma subunit